MKKFFETYKYAIIIILQGAILSYLFSNNWIIYIGLALSLLSFLFKPFLLGLTKIEELLSETIAKIVNTILLSLVYFAFVIPIGLIKKMMSTKNVTKGFIINEKEYKKEDLINPW